MYGIKKYSHHPNIKSLLNDLIADENTLFDFISLNKGNVNWEHEPPKSTSKIIEVKPPYFHKVVQVEHSYLNIDKLKLLNFKSKFNINKIVDNLIQFYNEQ